MEALRGAVSLNENNVTAWATMGNLILEHGLSNVELGEGDGRATASVPRKALYCFEQVLRLCPQDAEMKELVMRLQQLEAASRRPAVPRPPAGADEGDEEEYEDDFDEEGDDEDEDEGGDDEYEEDFDTE